MKAATSMKFKTLGEAIREARRHDGHINSDDYRYWRSGPTQKVLAERSNGAFTRDQLAQWERAAKRIGGIALGKIEELLAVEFSGYGRAVDLPFRHDEYFDTAKGPVTFISSKK